MMISCTCVTPRLRKETTESSSPFVLVVLFVGTELLRIIMSLLTDRFLAEDKSFGRLKKLCESKVVRWKYWDWPEWHWDPDYFMEARQKPKQVAKEKARLGYGYDKDNRVVVVQELFGRPNKIECVEFLRHSGNKIVGSHFLDDGKLADVFEATLSGGRIVRVERLWASASRASDSVWEWKTIAWKEDKIVTVVEGMRGRKAHRQITYSKAGKVTEVRDLSKPIERKPLPKGVTMKSLAITIREKLAAAVVATVAKARIKERVYCLVLNYDCEGNPLLLPELGIGLDFERKARLKGGGHDAKRDIWNPEEFSLFANARTALQGRDKELDRACDLFNRELEHKDSDEPARKLILQVAVELAKVDWSGKLNTTDDFVVYAVDTDGADLNKNLKLIVPPKKLAKLKATGCL